MYVYPVSFLLIDVESGLVVVGFFLDEVQGCNIKISQNACCTLHVISWCQNRRLGFNYT